MNRSKEPANRRGQVWSFLNSAFGLFLLSSIVLGGLSFLHTEHKRAVERRDQVEQLDLEIALRIRDMQRLATGRENNRYSTVASIGRISNGETSKFYLRRPLSRAFEGRSLSDLLWQLYLLVPRDERPAIKVAVNQAVALNDAIASFRYRAADALPERPEGKTKEEEGRLAEAEDLLKGDFGQVEAYRQLAAISATQRWRSFP